MFTITDVREGNFSEKKLFSQGELIDEEELLLMIALVTYF